MQDCLKQQLASYPNLSITDFYVESWYRLFKRLSILTFEEALQTACRNSKPGFPPVPSDLQAALNDLQRSDEKITNSVDVKVFHDGERGMDRVLTTVQKLGAKGKIEIEQRSHFRANQEHVTKLLKENSLKKIYMEEWTTAAGVAAYLWTNRPTGNRSRVVIVDGVEIPVYAR